MKFSAHLEKGVWGFATKLLPAVYGVVMTILVFKILPKSESGELALFQVIFGMIFTFADSFALQAIVKFGVDSANDAPRRDHTDAVRALGSVQHRPGRTVPRRDPRGAG